ncbi:MAG: hypothetical protein BWY71_00869 [Planctomycetes bacterium ADurb.Bin412]|nr:MAG: hypothetical protein BWY71_00869 [Planctomycetes bacterium ADurb.Bin412]
MIQRPRQIHPVDMRIGTDGIEAQRPLAGHLCLALPEKILRPPENLRHLPSVPVCLKLLQPLPERGSPRIINLRIHPLFKLPCQPGQIHPAGNAIFGNINILAAFPRRPQQLDNLRIMRCPWINMHIARPRHIRRHLPPVRRNMLRSDFRLRRICRILLPQQALPLARTRIRCRTDIQPAIPPPAVQPHQPARVHFPDHPQAVHRRLEHRSVVFHPRRRAFVQQPPHHHAHMVAIPQYRTA